MSFASDYRPTTLDEMVGQTHLVGKNGMLRVMLENNNMSSCIFYGPPGVGKTTAAHIAANMLNCVFEKMNATTASTKDIQTLTAKARKNGEHVLLCLDEIQYFNKKQQQVLLEPVEDGTITLIAMTTENPHFSCLDALLSRCYVLEFKPITIEDVLKNLQSVWDKYSADHTDPVVTPEALQQIANISCGDVRQSLAILDMAIMTHPTDVIDANTIQSITPNCRTSRFDIGGDIHYNLLSAFQKSIRGSDPDAAVFYLARLLEGGDMESPCRRLMVIANEDIGLAQPDAVPFVYACVQMAKSLGLAEADKPLTNATLYLALSPKCSTAEDTYNAAAADVKQGLGPAVPPYLQYAHSKGYLFPHNYPNHWVPQQYLPYDIKDHVYYHPQQSSAFEQGAASYWSAVKNTAVRKP